jgi:ABC-type glycerol-3-phosphate transport system substrate-binding protein
MKKFDAAIGYAALAALVIAFLFFPVQKVNFKETTLVFSQWFTDDMESEAFDSIVAEFEESHPGISITREYRNMRGIKYDCSYYLDVIKNESNNDMKKETRKFPDIIAVDPLWLNDLEKRMLFEDQNVSEDRDGGAKNESYTKPLYAYFNALFYNIEILEDSGFDRPPKTRNEVTAISRKLKEKNIYGLSVSENFFTDILPWIWPETDRNALQILNVEKDKFDFTEKSVVDSLDFFHTLNSQNTLGRPPFIKDEEEKINNFTAGKTAMITASSKLIKRLESDHSDMRFGITNIPTKDYFGRPIFSMSSVHAAILSSSRNKEAAFLFIDFLASKNAALAAAAGAVSPDAAMFGYPQTAAASYGKPVYAKAQSMIESAESVDDWKLFSACAALDSIAAEETGAMFRYRRSAAATAVSIKKRYDVVVK